MKFLCLDINRFDRIGCCVKINLVFALPNAFVKLWPIPAQITNKPSSNSNQLLSAFACSISVFFGVYICWIPHVNAECQSKRFGRLLGGRLIKCLSSSYLSCLTDSVFPITVHYFFKSFDSFSPFDLLLRVWLMDGRSLQGSIQLHSTTARPATADDLQWLLRQDGQTFKITYAILDFDWILFSSVY